MFLILGDTYLIEQTGSGFIKAVREESENGYEIKLPASHVDGGQIKLGDYRSNPATNEWVPNIDQHQVITFFYFYLNFVTIELYYIEC